MQTIDRKRHLFAKPAHLFYLFHLLMLPGGCFEIHLVTEAIANANGRLQQCQARGGQKLGSAVNLGLIFGNGDVFLAGAQTHAHFAIDAPGVGGRGLQLFRAPAQLKQIEKMRIEALRRRPAGERPEVDARRSGQLRHNLAPREAVCEGDANVKRHPQIQQL